MKVIIPLYVMDRLAVRIVDFLRALLSVEFWLGSSRHYAALERIVHVPGYSENEQYIYMNTYKRCPSVFVWQFYDRNCQTWWVSWEFVFVFLHWSTYWSRKFVACRHNGYRITLISIYMINCQTVDSWWELLGIGHFLHFFIQTFSLGWIYQLFFSNFIENFKYFRFRICIYFLLFWHRVSFFLFFKFQNYQW